ncbi:hypothetical protein [Listeria phage LP-KV022]|uniref:Uncharacterized protein n=6 Tax=Homburgvirus TaxID=1921125 RepID=A0A5A4K6R6_9CAUD|nr:hypothetical protein P70_0070 [Listeria phage P70]YP_008240380.1 hypothetical protein LP110_016 [Listeria phage LP-110]YP_009045105.1 hypothetical protein LP114_051 [Listeria phage LP-114]AWY07710.1 hypothetical protein [Listeria phage LP-KV022]QDK04574.1 hypothetical protein FK481_0060 [Listeria phage LP-010]QDK04683.1 hypothetical protein FK482_0061 [Listeria phage LP-013]AFQ96259.1 hypothetical protein P70_0070 [Listeria phage P70]AGI11519.1 hypothetical protein LP110_016 [Listeria pha
MKLRQATRQEIREGRAFVAPDALFAVTEIGSCGEDISEMELTALADLIELTIAEFKKDKATYEGIGLSTEEFLAMLGYGSEKNRSASVFKVREYFESQNRLAKVYSKRTK